MRSLPGGARIRCDLSVPYEAMVWLADEEERELQALAALLQAGQTFVDCGANIGLWTLVAAPAVGPTGRVIACEPHPETFRRLTDNVTANHCAAFTTLHNLACGEVPGEAPFHCDPAHNVSRIVAGGSPGSIHVPVRPLDELLGKAEVHGMKLDVEGYELPALRGAERVLRQQRPWLCVEFNTLLADANRLGDWPVHQYLTQFGYACRRFDAVHSHAGNDWLPADWTTAGYCNLYYAVV